jgi:hypothetical protein
MRLFSRGKKKKEKEILEKSEKKVADTIKRQEKEFLKPNKLCSNCNKNYIFNNRDEYCRSCTVDAKNNEMSAADHKKELEKKEIDFLIKQKLERHAQILKEWDKVSKDNIFLETLGDGLDYLKSTSKEQIVQNLKMEMDKLLDEVKTLRYKRDHNYVRSDQITSNNSKSDGDEPLKVLKLRYAKGEITKEEYNKMKSVLE